MSFSSLLPQLSDEQAIWIAYMAMPVMAIPIIHFGSREALLEVHQENSEKMSRQDAMWFPLIGSCVLFGFYLAFKYFEPAYLNYLLMAYFGCFGVATVGALLTKVLERNFPRLTSLGSLSVSLKLSDKPAHESVLTCCHLIGYLLASAVTAVYAYSRHWVLNNVLGIAFSISAISTLHLDSFGTGMALLAGLFLYDIFWVFGTDVMVSVAKNFEVPVKLLFPRNLTSPDPKFTLLGLGDIVIPGVMVALCLRFDTEKPSARRRYYELCLAFYAAGLVTTVLVMHCFKAAQPALLYLSPACTLPILAMAALRGELKELFAFGQKAEEASKPEEEGSDSSSEEE